MIYYTGTAVFHAFSHLGSPKGGRGAHVALPRVCLYIRETTDAYLSLVCGNVKNGQRYR